MIVKGIDSKIEYFTPKFKIILCINKVKIKKQNETNKKNKIIFSIGKPIW